MPASLSRGVPRVLVLTAYYFPFQGGIETHARTLVAYLASRGFPVQVVTRRPDAVTPSRDELDGVPVYRVGPAGPRTGWRKWLMLAPALVQILRLRHAVDVIYCPGYQGIGLAAIAAGKLLGCPVILRSGNLGVLRGDNWNAPLARWHVSPTSMPVRILKASVRRLYMLADGFVCNCREIETEALECGVPRAAVHYVPNAVDVTEFRPAQAGETATIRVEEGWPADALVCLYVGRLSVEKGVLDLLDAWQRLQAPNRLLVLVGPDMPGNAMDAGPAARRFVAERGLDRLVRFHGPAADTARLWRAADIGVLPSHYEAFSNALIEAMSSGLPMVASRVGGVLDCVVDEENGLLAAPRTPADLSRQLARLLGDGLLRQTLGHAARATVERSFERDTVFARLAALLAATAGQRHP